MQFRPHSARLWERTGLWTDAAALPRFVPGTVWTGSHPLGIGPSHQEAPIGEGSHGMPTNQSSKIDERPTVQVVAAGDGRAHGPGRFARLAEPQSGPSPGKKRAGSPDRP